MLTMLIVRNYRLCENICLGLVIDESKDKTTHSKFEFILSMNNGINQRRSNFSEIEKLRD